MITIEDLHKYYGDQRAIGPLSAQVTQGQVVGLLGLNGAGKTTTLRVLACDLLPTSGSVKVGGFDVVSQPHEVRKRTGYLPDIPPLYGDMTVIEYLRFVARLRGVPGAQVAQRVAAVEEQTDIGEVRQQIISTLSHGYRQRVGIAQAIVHRPKFVVLDEPISGLDPAQIVEMRRLVRDLRGEHTVVVSSHILSEISETCDHILVIRDGEIVAAGTEAQLAAAHGGMRVDITVRGTNESDELEQAARRALEKIDSIQHVEPIQAEEGEGTCSLRVTCQSDIRDEICRALVQKGLGVLELTRSEHELEAIFLELSAADSGRRAQATKQGAAS